MRSSFIIAPQCPHSALGVLPHSRSTVSLQEWSRMLESYSQSQKMGKDIADKQNDPAGDDHIAADDDDDPLPLEEALRRTPQLEGST